MQCFSGFFLLMAVFVVHGCNNQCEELDPRKNVNSFAPIGEGEEELENAEREYREMKIANHFHPRDKLINLSPMAIFDPPSFFVKRCFPINCGSGLRYETTSNKTSKFPVKQLVSEKECKFFHVTVEEHTNCRCVPDSSIKSAK